MRSSIEAMPLVSDSRVMLRFRFLQFTGCSTQWLVDGTTIFDTFATHSRLPGAEESSALDEECTLEHLLANLNKYARLRNEPVMSLIKETSKHVPMSKFVIAWNPRAVNAKAWGVINYLDDLGG